MKFSGLSLLCLSASAAFASPTLNKRDGFEDGDPFNPETGEGGPITGK